MRTLTKLTAILVTALSLNCQASITDLIDFNKASIITGGLSYHWSSRSRELLNQQHEVLGFGYRYSEHTKFNITYIENNSFDVPSVYVSYQPTYDIFEDYLSVHGILGAATGYDELMTVCDNVGCNDYNNTGVYIGGEFITPLVGAGLSVHYKDYPVSLNIELTPSVGMLYLESTF